MNNNGILFFSYGTDGSTNKDEQERRPEFFSGVTKKSSTIAVKMSGMGLVIQQPASVLSRNGMRSHGLDQYTCVVGSGVSGGDAGPATAGDGAVGDWD